MNINPIYYCNVLVQGKSGVSLLFLVIRGDKIGDVLFSIGEISDCLLWYPDQSISNFAKCFLGRFIVRSSSSSLLRQLNACYL